MHFGSELARGSRIEFHPAFAADRLAAITVSVIEVTIGGEVPPHRSADLRSSERSSDLGGFPIGRHDDADLPVLLQKVLREGHRVLLAHFLRFVL